MPYKLTHKFEVCDKKRAIFILKVIKSEIVDYWGRPQNTSKPMLIKVKIQRSPVIGLICENNPN